MSTLNRDTYIIIPSYNEGKVLANTLAPLIAADYSVIVVDDGSSDDTWSILQELPVFALRHPINLGQGAALQTGMTFANQRGAEYIVHFDADGQHQLKDIERFVAILRDQSAQVVLGSRFLNHEDTRLVPLSKQIILKVATIVNYFLTGLLLSDAHNGFRALTGEAARKINLLENGFSHASEIIYQIRMHKLSFVECPTTIVYSSYSRAKGQSFWNAFNIVIDLVIRKLLP